jgi:riboflavin synthase
MFTGIIETVGQVKEISSNGSNKSFWIESSLSVRLRPDQSVSHNGACLTIEKVNGNLHLVTAVEETLQKTEMDRWEPGTQVNLERSLLPGDRIDGHLVQGHVDCTATCTKLEEKDGSHEYEFRIPKSFAHLVIEKGSICVNGISLTCFDARKKSFRVAIVPYTYEHTNIRVLKEGDPVNIEFDIVGKYISRSLSLSKDK